MESMHKRTLHLKSPKILRHFAYIWRPFVKIHIDIVRWYVDILCCIDDDNKFCRFQMK